MVLRWLALALGLIGFMPAAQGQDFYKGKNVFLTIGYSVGGGYDLYARLLARYIGGFLPGNPSVLPQSMPGAGSLKSILYLYGVAPKDGTTFGTFGRTMPLEPLFSGAQFDAQKLGWLGSITSDVSLCVTWGSSPIKTWDDLMAKHAKLGGQAAGSDPDVYASILKTMFGSDAQLVTGYPGNNEQALAMERGEIDGYCGLSYSSLLSGHPEWLSGKKVNIIVQAALEKSAALPDVPMLLDKTTDPKKLAALKMILTTQELARPYAAPPGLPPERLAMLREAFDKTVASPEFLTEAKKLKLDVAPVPGTKLQKLLAEVYANPPDVIALAKASAGY